MRGIYSSHGHLPLDVVRLNNPSQRVIGTMEPTSPNDCLTVIHLAIRLGLADLITQRFGLNALKRAIVVARSGEAIVVARSGEAIVVARSGEAIVVWQGPGSAPVRAARSRLVSGSASGRRRA